jgi:two-component system osmolarity sensor histidine kinase EnvZ
VTEAAEAIGRGAPPPPLREQGARELRRLSAGINRMVEDLHTRAEDHREILAGISHDLRTPLTRMRLALELSSDQLEPELAQGMGQDLDDMDRIIGRFLDYARHGSEESPAAIDFVPLVREVVDRYRRGETAIVLETPASCPLHGRPLALVRLVTNLVDNAVRHARTAIHVRLETTPTGCVLTVEDRGPGLDPTKAQALLAPLRPRPGVTVGLGLRTVGRIARLHNAEVKITARLGGGTRVAVTFPGTPAAGASAETAEHPNP